MTSKPQRPARPADQVGSVERDGVTIAYRVYNSTAVGPTVMFLPTWSIVPSRIWKAQVPYLAKHFRVVTFDGRGSGRSSAPAGASAYADSEFVADTLAVLAATGTGTCVLVSLSRGVPWALQVAHELPDQVLGVVCIGSAAGLVPAQEERIRWSWNERHDTTDGWAKYNKHYWTEGGYDDFLRFFFAQMFPEPHSSKQLEDAVGWGHEISPERLVDTEAARQDRVPGVPSLSCPVLVVHGSDDKIRPLAEGIALADQTNGSLVTVEGGGHAPNARDPVLVNRLLKDFVSGVTPPQPVRRTWVRALNRPKRVLYLSSPIGLGHARRDLAIARELRVRNPGLEIDWLAQHPVTRVLADAGETVHPASAYLLNESSHIEFEADEHDLHAFQAIRRMDEILVANFLTFTDVVDDRHYDLVIGDEAWDVDYFLHENPELKKYAYAWLTDFVGWLPLPDGGPAEAALTADYNAEMLEQRARFRRLRDRSIFIGDPDDIVADTFGPGLPSIRSWTSQNFDFTGYITGFDPSETADRPALRARLGYPPDAKLCLVTVGGSGVGTALLQRVLDAIPLARHTIPDLQFIVVTGPRIAPSTLPSMPGATIHGYLPNLHHHLAAADVAITQGGLTTCMELTAARVPFIYVPLQHHFEQTFHVPARLNRHNAGHLLPYSACTPTTLAETLAKLLITDVDYLPVPTTATQTAAALLTDLL
ncbi:pimeloyl-ACP methyl ester carboxylesterase [Kribbella voronezhensis]|uniref:Pimeloyl-ACP methyl ester carboxylesterase n=1 Tax=Kribbella voronezhensis TaxID=2512212 RepID=A0A4R7TIY2_9ACTN|nr:alpha/beta fold hydrolase [Kribbella voronezhensis]TDU91487.1 pimeloyl-ACP methyl ester carboxylesterase [Kribbella voronezhensis]